MRIHRLFRVLAPMATLLAGFLVCYGTAQAQFLTDNTDWKESEVPPPPAFDVNKLLTFDVSKASSLVYGVDPSTLTVSLTDSVVRYVVVATSPSGVRNIMYEGIRCATGEVKTYARYLSDARWSQVVNAEWRPMSGPLASKHALHLAKTVACDSASPVSSVQELVSRLKSTRPYLD